MIQIARGLRPLAAVTAAVVLSATMTTSTQAAVPSGAVTGSTATVATGEVLESAFGEARSRVKGTFGNNGVVTGEFKPRRFVERNGKLMVVGVLDATLTRASGAVVDTVEQRVKLPVRLVDGQPVGARLAQQQQACQILRLVLGPLDLDLLGLHVHLNRVVLVIEAHPGPGNLLGNLLCAIAGLLDGVGGNALLREIILILNAILAILRL